MPEPSKAVLITGCSSGIGRASALRLSRAGYRVYATARRPESLADLKEAGCETLALDVTDEESMRAAVDAIELAEGAVGALINNAGYSQSGAIETVSLDAARRQFETNVFGFNATVGAVTKGAYDGPMRLLGGGPDRVAKVIERAISRRRAPMRIRVTPSAKIIIATRRLLSDRTWDAAMRTQYPQPK